MLVCEENVCVCVCVFSIYGGEAVIPSDTLLSSSQTSSSPHGPALSPHNCVVSSYGKKVETWRPFGSFMASRTVNGGVVVC